MDKRFVLSQRSQAIQPFQVMDILAQAKSLQAAGRDVIHLEVGEPDFPTPQPIIEAGVSALKSGNTFYTPALGLPELRVQIAQWYDTYYGIEISPKRIVVTPGASGALLLVMGALLEAGKQLLMTDPGYPCNRHFARFVEAEVQAVPVDASSAYQLTSQHIADYWQPHTQMALIATPSNPTGTILEKASLKSIADAVRERKGILVVDEIYHGLNETHLKLPTVLEVADDAIVINSFSKFFGMTGWRLGWAVIPESLEPVFDRLAQNLFLAAPTPAQYAALAAFQSKTLDILFERQAIFQQRRDSLLPALTDIGFHVPAKPQGAFYIYADCSALLNERWPDSQALAAHILSEAGVAVTPGYDFGKYRAEHYIRFAYTTNEARLLQAVERIANSLK